MNAKFTLLCLFMACFTLGLKAQTISPEPGDFTTCPGEPFNYQVIPATSQTGCGTVTWTVTHGSFSSNTPITTTSTAVNVPVTVYWDDYAADGGSIMELEH